MPDIDFQKIVLNLIPKKGDEPVIFYASQYETARPFIADLMWGDTEFAPGDDSWAEIDIRKNDDNVVVITDDVTIDNNEVSVVLPVQAVTCIGNNLGQVKIYAADDQLIAALNFILHVQLDPLAGGVTSETEIDNLTQQIEDIATEVIGEDYYDKTEVDALLNDKADVSDLPDMSQYYTKTATDTLLSAKADTATTYTKSETDILLSAKANTADLATVATTGDYDDLLNKPVLPDMTQYYTKSEVDTLIDNIYPTLTASGELATFTTALNKPLVSVTADPLAITITRCGKNMLDVTLTSQTVNDVVFTVNSDKTITANGTANGNIFLQIGTIHVVAGQTYTLTGCPAGGGLGVYSLYAALTGGNKNDYGSGNTFTATATEDAPVRIAVYNTQTINGTYKPQIELGSSPTVYEEYNSITVNKDLATTIETLTGVNNVFADAGSVTVQYKYMSI